MFDIVGLSTKYWWLVNLLPLSCKTGVDNHLCSMFVEFCHHAHLGVRVELGSGLTPDLTHTWPADVQYLSSIGREGTHQPMTSVLVWDTGQP